MSRTYSVYVEAKGQKEVPAYLRKKEPVNFPTKEEAIQFLRRLARGELKKFATFSYGSEGDVVIYHKVENNIVKTFAVEIL